MQKQPISKGLFKQNCFVSTKYRQISDVLLMSVSRHNLYKFIEAIN